MMASLLFCVHWLINLLGEQRTKLMVAILFYAHICSSKKTYTRIHWVVAIFGAYYDQFRVV